MTPVHTKDLSDGFFEGTKALAVKLKTAPINLVCTWYSESGCKASALNPHGGAAGIFQAMPFILDGLGYHGGPFNQLTAEEQLPWAEKYYAPYVGKVSTKAAVYVANFLPAFIDNAGNPNFVLASSTVRAWAYNANAGFDRNGDLAITVSELDLAISRQCVGKRWDELLSRLEGREMAATKPEELDLRTVRGWQEALIALGFNPGEVDGWWGPKTMAATKAFQKRFGLDDDGVVGPMSRSGMALALKAPSA